jgi:hypothetical protein
MKKTLAALASLLLLAGCFEIDQSIHLQKDLSGTADFHLGIDFEPMVVIMAQFGREMEGKKGPISAAELAKAKAEFKKSMKSEKSSPDLDRAELAKSLPKGVELLDFQAKEQEFGIATDMKFAFDKIQSLIGVKLPSKEGADPTQKNVIDTPFEGLEIVEKGDTITIRTKATNPAKDVEKEAEKSGAPPNPEMEKMMKDAFKKLRVSYRITTPFKVVSHNATRVEGNTLVWVYDMETFEKLEKKGGDFPSPTATFRR